jgi:integrase
MGLAGFTRWRLRKLQVSTVNSSLRVLRRVLRLAVEWGALDAAPTIKLLRGERHRERVATPEEEAKYLAAAPNLVGSIAAVLLDTGLRPEECFRLVWEALTWTNGRHGTLLVTHGKTPATRRVLPMTARVRNILEARWEAAGKPEEGLVWPAPTRSGRVESSSLKKQHAKALELSKVRAFVLYSLRHPFLTRLGQSGCDVWTLFGATGKFKMVSNNAHFSPPFGPISTVIGDDLSSRRTIDHAVGMVIPGYKSRQTYHLFRQNNPGPISPSYLSACFRVTQQGPCP